MDEEGELRDSVGEPWSRSRVVRVRVDGDRATRNSQQPRLSIAKLFKRVVSTREAVTTGTPRTWGGQSHSSEAPTSEPASPSSATISVALGSREQIRIMSLSATGCPTLRAYRRRLPIKASRNAV